MVNCLISINVNGDNSKVNDFLRLQQLAPRSGRMLETQSLPSTFLFPKKKLPVWLRFVLKIK